MTDWGSILAGVGLFVVGINVGIIWVRSELEQAVKLLNEAKRHNSEIKLLLDGIGRKT